MSDLIDRQEAIEHCKKRLYESAYNNTMVVCDVSYIMQDIADNRIDVWLKELPSAQPEPCKETAMRLIDADALRASMYHEAFEKDTDFQKWDSGCWIRYKLFEDVLDNAPTIKTISLKEAIEEYYKRQCDAIAKAVFSIRSYDKQVSEGENK